DGTSPHLRLKNSNAAGKPTGQVGTIGIGGLGQWQLFCHRIWLRSDCLYNRERTTPPGKESGQENFMERLAACSVVIGFLCLVSSLPAFAGAEHGFSIKVFTSLDDQFCVISVIIEGAHEVMLVDAQLTKTGAERVLQEIKDTKKPLSIIYITHEHADHFLGLEVFKEAYPRVRIIANSSVVDRINKVYQAKVDKWKTILGPGATSHVVAVEQFDGTFITFGSS